MAESVRGVSALQSELDKAKESLKDVDENIKKLTGRDPTIQRVQQRRVALGATDRGGRTQGVEGRLFNLARRGIIQEETSPVKRAARAGGAFSRLGPLPSGRPRRGGRGGRDSGEEDDLPQRPAVPSSVHATSREERSRQNSIEEQSKDRKGQARNRRMFGLLLGTLQKFKDDAAVSKDKEEQRQKIEKKLDEKFKQEKEEIIQERRNLFVERRKKQFKIRLLEQKMEMAQNHEDWERETKKLENFIITKAKPCLFYLPKTITPDTEAKLAETREAIKGMIAMRRKKLEEEIVTMMNQVQDDGDIGEGDDQGESGEEEIESDEERLDDKENKERDRGEKDGEDGDDPEVTGELKVERERRDREREQKDRDRQQRERKGREYRGRSKDRSRSKEKSSQREHSGGRRESEKDKDKDRSPRKRRSRSEKSRSRERHRSGKHRSERKRDNSEDDKSHRHRSSSKSKRRSKGEGRGEKKEKIWEPMEDEVEEEFVGSRGEGEKVSIASKMLQMAGMAEAVQEAKAIEDEKSESVTEESSVPVGDIPEPDNDSQPGIPVGDEEIHTAANEQSLNLEGQIDTAQP